MGSFLYQFHEKCFGEKSIRILGLSDSDDEQFCINFHIALMQGRADIRTDKGKISFIYEGVTLNFPESKKNLSIICAMRENGMVIEPFKEGALVGFEISARR